MTCKIPFINDEFTSVEREYNSKKQQLDAWKNTFQQLEKEIQELACSFEEKYKQSSVGDEFVQDIKGKLENRREGIRLSVKSTSRLLRKLNPEKPLEDSVAEFILIEQINVPKCEQSETLTLNSPSSIEHPLVMELTVNEEKNDNTEEGKGTEAPGLGQLQLDEGDSLKTDVVLHEKERETSIQADILQVIVKQAENQEAINLSLEEILYSNRNVVQQLNEHVEAAEKRFLTFIEKGVAPIMDGLYSGQNYAKDLVMELKNAGHQQLEQAEGWLKIYEDLLKVVQTLFDQFAVELFIPNIGDAFNEYKHEPIGVVEDSSFQDEQVKEVVRYGLIYKNLIFNEDSFLIRPAQVIVVKNRN